MTLGLEECQLDLAVKALRVFTEIIADEADQAIDGNKLSWNAISVAQMSTIVLSSIHALSSLSTGAAGAKKGKSSAYNKYMKDQLAKLKTEKPSITHKERFKLAATSWASSKENPKNKA
ncbi:hypothetical protein NDA18_005938 [Ustilago nuda]|nr:hypothetical protein NDA18_005938 [Ustilago nuda]